jgi:hypothetical protein
MSATPNGTVVLAFSEAALNAETDSVDVTEAVKFAYDTVIGSLDWGSGFLSHDEEHLICDLGRTLGFEVPRLSCMGRRLYYPRYDPNGLNDAIHSVGGCNCAGYWETDYSRCRHEGIADG